MFLVTLLMILVLYMFLLGCMRFPMSGVATVITIIAAIIVAFAICFQMKRKRNIKEAEFIMSYNTSILENNEFIKIEKMMKNTLEKIILEENHQCIVNYLV